MARESRFSCDSCGRDITMNDGRGGYRLQLEIKTVWGGENAPLPPLADPDQFHFCDPDCLRAALDREHPAQPGRPFIALPAPQEGS